jgi:hypothetical protein
VTKETRDYYTAHLDIGEDHRLLRRKTERGLEILLGEVLMQYPDAKGWKSTQTFQIDEQDAPGPAPIKEVCTGSVNGGSPPILPAYCTIRKVNNKKVIWPA